MGLDFSKIVSSIKEGMPTGGSRGIVGVDIGASAIKVVQIHEEKGIPTLDTYGELQLGPYMDQNIGEPVMLDDGKLTEALVDILREASVTATDVSLAVAYGSSFATIISVPTTDEKEISAIMPVEARKYIPVPLSQVTLDWFPVSTHQESNSTNILLAAIHHDALRTYHTVMQRAKLNIKFTEIEIFSAIRSSVAQTDKTVAILDCAAGATKLYITRDGLVGKMHSVRQGGTGMTNMIASIRKVPFTEAEDMKRTQGFSAAGDTEEVQREVFRYYDQGFRELRQVISEFTMDEGVNVEKIILCGSGSLLPGFDTYVADRLQIPVVYANAFAKVAYPAFLEDTLTQAGPTFAVALGAALRLMTES